MINRKFALDILWEKFGEKPFWMSKAIPIVEEYLGCDRRSAEREILDSMVGGAIVCVESSKTVHNCTCDGGQPHTHYDGNLQFKFNTMIWNPSTPRGATNDRS